MKKFFRIKYLLISLFGALSLIAGAQNISEQQAREYAIRFFDQYPAVRSPQTELDLVWTGEDPLTKSSMEEPAFYVYNRGKNNGFVIISGNKAVKPILAYSLDGQFCAEGMPDNLRAWMQALKENIREKSEHPTRSSSISQAWENISPMSGEVDLQTADWDQMDPYNKKCPKVSGQHCPTGCAITAAAIIMEHHQWPPEGEGSLPSYQCESLGRQLGPVTLGETYPWNDMDPETISGGNNIATLMWHLGVMAQAEYTLGGTGAPLFAFEYGLPIYMHYDTDVTLKDRYEYTDTEWKQMLRNEIDGNRPVFYQGFGDEEGNGGHAFVLDGYNAQGYFNINWGWSALANGFYDLDNLTPEENGTGAGSLGQYNVGQGALFGLKPRPASQKNEDNIQFVNTYGYQSDGISVTGLAYPAKQGDHFNIIVGGIQNHGTNTDFGELVLAMTDRDGNIIERFVNWGQLGTLPHDPMSYILLMETPMSLTISQPVEAGFRIQVLFQSNISGKWIPIRSKNSEVKWEIPLTEEESIDVLGDSSSLHYDATTGKITLTTLAGTTVTLQEKVSGQDLSAQLVQEGNQFSFEKKNFKAGTYILCIQKGTDKKELEIEL